MFVWNVLSLSQPQNAFKHGRKIKNENWLIISQEIYSHSLIWYVTKNPFAFDVLQLSEEIQEEFPELNTNYTT